MGTEGKQRASHYMQASLSASALGLLSQVLVHRRGVRAADEATRWFLAEWFNRMLGFGQDEQATLQDVMGSAALGVVDSQCVRSAAFDIGTRRGQKEWREARDRRFLEVLNRGCAGPAPCGNSPVPSALLSAGAALERGLRREPQAWPTATNASMPSSRAPAACVGDGAHLRRWGARFGRMRGFSVVVPNNTACSQASKSGPTFGSPRRPARPPSASFRWLGRRDRTGRGGARGGEAMLCSSAPELSLTHPS